MNRLLVWMTGLLLAVGVAGSANAIPKAAEDESAPVTKGADAPKPKKAKPTNPNPSEKKSARKGKVLHKAK